MKVETTVLKLEEVFGVLSHAQTFELITNLKKSKKELDYIVEITKIKMAHDISEGNDASEGFEIIKDVDLQMIFLNANIDVLETALMCYETKIFEKRTFNNLPFNIGLN